MLSKHKTYAKVQAGRTCLSDAKKADKENSLCEVSSIRLYFVLVLFQDMYVKGSSLTFHETN